MDWKFSSTLKLNRLLKSLEKRQRQLLDNYNDQVDQIMIDPTLGKKLRGDLSDYYSWDWKFQGSSVRICYKVNSAKKTVQIVYFGTRENFYKDLKNYIKR